MGTCLYTRPARYHTTCLYTRPALQGHNMGTFTKVAPTTAAWVPSQRYHHLLQHGHLPLHEASQVPHNMPRTRPALHGHNMGTFTKVTPITAAWVPSQRYRHLLQHGYLPLHQASSYHTTCLYTRPALHGAQHGYLHKGNTNYCSMGTCSKVPPPAAARVPASTRGQPGTTQHASARGQPYRGTTLVPSQRYYHLLQQRYLPLHEASQVPHNC